MWPGFAKRRLALALRTWPFQRASYQNSSTMTQNLSDVKNASYFLIFDTAERGKEYDKLRESADSLRKFLSYVCGCVIVGKLESSEMVLVYFSQK